MRRLTFICVLILFGVTILGCSGSSSHAGDNLPPSTVVTSTPLSRLSPRTTTTTTGLTSASVLGSSIVSAPDGFALSTASDVHNGTMTASHYDASVDYSGAAVLDHFVTGYEVTYDDIDSTADNYIWIMLARLGSPSDAAKYGVFGKFGAGKTLENKYMFSRVASMPDAYEVDETQAESDGTYTQAIWMTKGALLMVVSYTGSSAEAPPLLMQLAEAQARRLPT